MANYLRPSGSGYDPEFRAWRDSIAPARAGAGTWNRAQGDRTRQKIKEFYVAHGHLPSQGIGDQAERRLAQALSKFSKSGLHPEFTAWVNSIKGEV